MIAVLSWVALAAPQPPPLRLEDGTPLSYGVELWLDPASDTFRGQVAIEVDLGAPTRLLWLNAGDLEIGAAAVSQGDRVVTAEVLDGDEQTVGLSWDAPLDGVVTVDVAWTGRVQQDASYGLFHQSEGGRDYLFTQFEALEARRVIPCFDQPEFKTPWTLVLHVPPAVGAWGNAPQASAVEGEGERVVTFAPTRPLPSYLVAFAVGPFEVVDAGHVGETPLRLLVPPGRARDAAWAVETLAPILAWEEAWFDRPYPYDKLDVVVVPLTVGFGAMEHPGLITVSQSIALAPGELDTIERRKGWADVMSHELAHQWFGNLVTFVWWDDLWLSESFANWLETELIVALWPEWDPEIDRVSIRAEALAADSLPSVRRVREPIRETGDVEAAFDAITYQKGQSVLGAVESWIGPDAFQRGIRRYLADHAHGTATIDDLVAALAAETSQPVGPVIEGYVDQSGAPLVTFDVSCDEEPRIALSQHKYVLSGRPGRARWVVPLCVRTDAGRSCTTLDRRTGEIPLEACPAWVVPNDGARGYYRAALSPEWTEKLLTEADLTLPEQVATLGDAGALVATGDLEPTLLLAKVPEFVALDEDAVTSEAIAVVASLDAHLVPDDLRPAYQRFVEMTFGPKARRLGFDAVPGEPTTTTMLRPQVLATVGHLGEDLIVRTEAIKRVGKWLDTREGIDPDVLPVMLEVAGHFGEPDLIARFRSAALAETDRDVRAMLFESAAATRDPVALRATLDLLLSPEVDLREMAALLLGPLAVSEQRPVAWAWVVDNLDALEGRVPAPFRFYLAYLGGNWCDAEHRREVEDVIGPRASKWLGGKRALQSNLETIDACMASTARQADGVRAFLEDW